MGSTSSLSLMKILMIVVVVVLASTKSVKAVIDDDYVNNQVIIDACPAIVKLDPTIPIGECLYELSAHLKTMSADNLKSLALGAIQYVKGTLAWVVTDLVDRQECVEIYSDVLSRLSDVEVFYSLRNLEAVKLQFKAVVAAVDSCAQKIQNVKDPKPIYLADETRTLSLNSRIVLAIIHLL